MEKLKTLEGVRFGFENSVSSPLDPQEVTHSTRFLPLRLAL